MKKIYSVGSSLLISFTLSIGVIETANATTASDSSINSFISQNVYSRNSMMSDAELNRIISALDALPEHLKSANPSTTPNLEYELSKALNGMKVGFSRQIYPGTISTQGTWWQCTAEVASIIVQYGLPVGKVLKWLKDAREIWGGVSGIWRAIRSGAAFSEIGEDGVQILEMLLGFEGVASACFS